MESILKSGDCQQIDTATETTISKLRDDARELADRSISEATKRAYKKDLALFVTWADSNNFEALPAEPETVALYITHLHNLGRKPATISRYLTSISQAHKIADLRTPTNAPEVVACYKGICRTAGTAQKQARALVLADLKKVISHIPPHAIGRRDAALLLVGWAGALRRSEIVALDFGDIDFVSEGLILTIQKSKTDQERKGYKIGIPFGRDPKMCPVKRLQHWIGLAGIAEGPIFFGIGTPGKKFFADCAKRGRLSARSVNIIIQKRTEQAGLAKTGYSGHSLRAGFCTSAAAAKIPEHIIRFHSRHRSPVSLSGYIREGKMFEENSLSILL